MLVIIVAGSKRIFRNLYSGIAKHLLNVKIKLAELISHIIKAIILKVAVAKKVTFIDSNVKIVPQTRAKVAMQTLLLNFAYFEL